MSKSIIQAFPNGKNNTNINSIPINDTGLTVGDIIAKDVALGTIIPGWLYADGSIYNIADYPQLAAHYASHHGLSNFYGGDGVTTFAVPDLRGEFLRGAGTNGHSGEGNGAGVGVHQNATSIPYSYIDDRVSVLGSDTFAYPSGGEESMKIPTNMDSYVTTTGRTGYYGKLNLTWESNNAYKSYSIRPTNTSYLFYIKATVGHTYSTDEQPVGTWIDGKILYEKTITGTTSINEDDNGSTVIKIANNLDYICITRSKVIYTNGTYHVPAPIQTMVQGSYDGIVAYTDGNYLVVQRRNKTINENTPFDVTVQYTKI